MCCDLSKEIPRQAAESAAQLHTAWDKMRGGRGAGAHRLLKKGVRTCRVKKKYFSSPAFPEGKAMLKIRNSYREEDLIQVMTENFIKTSERPNKVSNWHFKQSQGLLRS